MAKKITVSGNSLIIQDTVSSRIDLEENIRDVWFDNNSLNNGYIQIVQEDGSKASELLLGNPILLENSLDSNDVTYTSSTFRTFMRESVGAPYTSSSTTKDPWIEHAKQIIFDQDGVNVSMEAKNKDLIKFGRNKLIQTTRTTLMTLPTGVSNETYISTNGITTIVSSNASDNQMLKLEGHTISGGNFTFITQDVTLNGRTPVTLTTPLARANRVYNIGSTNLAGIVSVCQNDTFTLGVPNTPSKVHLIIDEGFNNSEKAATTIDNNDYWILTGFYADCLEKSSIFGSIHLEIREQGEVFRNKVDISASSSSPGLHDFKPYVIIKPNSDVRLRAISGTANKDFSGGIKGVLLTSS